MSEANGRPATGYKHLEGDGFYSSASAYSGHHLNPYTTNKVRLHTLDQFELDVWSVLEEAGQLLLSKHADYGPTNIANAPGGAINGLRVRIHDKIARINHLIDNGKDPQHESLRDSFIDLLNYSAIALMVIEDKWPR